MRHISRALTAAVLAVALLFAACPVFAALSPVDWHLAGYLPEDYLTAFGFETADELEKLAKVIFDAACSYQSYCDISSFEIPRSDEANLMLGTLILKSCPEAFHVGAVSYSASPTCFTKVNFKSYLFDEATYRTMLLACEDVADELIGDIPADLPQAEKVLLVHDRLACLCAYDYAGYLAEMNGQGKVDAESYTVYGALVNGRAVCEGYSQATCYLLERLGMECHVCSSSVLGHMWNIVTVDGKYYHTDVTWDDPTWDVTGRVEHDNLLRSTNGIKATDHTADDYCTLPTDTTYDQYYWQASNTAIQRMNNQYYYIDNSAAKLFAYDGTSAKEVQSVRGSWPAGNNMVWPNSARLSSDGEYLYYSLADAVYRFDTESGEAEECYRPDLSALPGNSIFGFTARDGKFICDLNDSPNFKADTKNKQIVYPYKNIAVESVEVEMPPIQTVYAVGSEPVFDGLILKVSYTNGTTRHVTEGFTVEAPDMTTPGSQTVLVTYGGCTASFTITVEEAEPGPGPGDDPEPPTPPAPATLGDVNGDGKVDSTDARLILQLYAKKISADAITVGVADVNGDGKIDSTDARLILQFYAKKIDTFAA